MTKNKWIMKFLKPYKWFFLSEFILITFMTTVGSILPFLNGELVNAFFYDKDMTAFINLCIIYAGILFFHQLVIATIFNLICSHLMTSFVYDIRRALFKKILHKNGKDLSGMYCGDIISRINNDTNDFMDLIFNSFIRGWSSILNIIYSVGLMCYYNIFFGAFTVVLVPVVVFTSRYFKRKSKKINSEIAKERGELSSYLFEVTKNLQELKVLNACKNIIRIYSRKTTFINKKVVESGRISVTSERINSLLALIARLLVFIICAYFIVKGRMQLGAFVAAISYFNRAVDNFNSINDHIVDIGRQTVSIQRVIDILNENEEDYKENISPKEIFDGVIEFKNVVFSYNEDKRVLDGINLRIEAGSTIGLVGKSGVGKTTLGNLLYKLYDVDNGEILIDGLSVNEYNLHSLRSQVGIVHQETILYNNTLRYNLSFSNDIKDDDLLLEAIKKAALYDVYLTLPNGLDTHLGTDGQDLSGGQKQRLAIARLLVKNPKILIFDESTSFLDSQNELLIRKVINDISKDRTLIIIAHRFSTIKNCDKIAVLAEGIIKGFDTHDKLMENNETYIDLFNQQCIVGEVI